MIPRADRRRGLAIPLVLTVLIVIVPVVMSLFLRSQTALKWLGKLQDQKQAITLAQEGEGAALDRIRAKSSDRSGSRAVAAGGMKFRLRYLGPGDAGQPVYAAAGEGDVRAETRLVLELVDVDDVGGSRVLLPHDRAWLPGTALARIDLERLVRAHARRIEDYQVVLLEESYQDPKDFISGVRSRVSALRSAELDARWGEIETELRKAKATRLPD